MHDFHEIRGGEDGAPRDDAHVFTEHIRLQIRGQDDHDNATAVLKKLKLLVKLKTDKKLASPAHLGISDQDDWDDQSREELVCQFYVRAFIDERRKLIEYVKAGETIDALITTKVGQFLIRLQKKTNPERYRIFKKIQQSVGLLLESGALDCSDGARIDNALILGIKGNAVDLSLEKLHEAVEQCDICGKRRVYRCSDAEVSEAIRNILTKGRFPLGELVRVIQERVPEEKKNIAASDEPALVYRDPENEFSGVDRIIFPDRTYEDKEAQDARVESMTIAIHESGRTAKVKKRLVAILSILTGSSDFSLDHLMRELKVSKTTIYDDLTQLRLLSEQCSRNS